MYAPLPCASEPRRGKAAGVRAGVGVRAWAWACVRAGVGGRGRGAGECLLVAEVWVGAPQHARVVAGEYPLERLELVQLVLGLATAQGGDTSQAVH